MEFKQIMFAGILTILLVLGAAGLYMMFSSMATASATNVRVNSSPADGAKLQPSAVVFSPPRPEDAPQDIREGVMLGYHILMDTQNYATEYVGNELNCRSCHFNAGRERNTLSLVGVAAKYPKFRGRSNYVTDLVTRTQGCFQRSMNGKPLPPEGKKMQAIMAYYHWISKDVPIYAEIPWLGLKKLESQHAPDKETGKNIYNQVCSRCHGGDGRGTAIAPPLWGPGSFNDGAGMHKLPNFSSFTHHFMPKANPSLTVEEALDVAAYATSQPRPHLQSEE
ncbi:MAG TPA: c-type cytochrome [Desulfopila sp.]|nr:c-type cytochrome [Desulfopila sp.]